jgi:uncharacterized protein (UPF0332 family)/regulator of sigma D
MGNKIEINAAIYPKVMSLVLGKPMRNEENNTVGDMEPELAIDLPRGAYLIYLQNMFDEHKEREIELFKKYAYGVVLDDADYSSLLDLIMTTTARNWNQSVSNGDILSKFGIGISEDENGKRKFVILEEAKDTIRVEAWEGIIIDLLNTSAMDIISCFDFESHFSRKNDNGSGNEKLYISLGAWKFSSDEAEQNLSNALRNAFMFTLVGYYSGDRKNQYSSFMDYFEAEFYKRVSLVFGIWSSLQNKADVKYMPLYDSFYNLSSTSKNDLIDILKALLDNQYSAVDEKQDLKNQLILSAGEFHNNLSASDTMLEQTLIKPAINLVLLREKAKETIASAEILLSEGKYVDCANRCYYAMMFSLKTLLEHQGKLANWKANELKESETHNSLENGLNDLVNSGILSSADKADFDYVKDQRWKCDYSLYCFRKEDAEHCVNLIKKFFSKIEGIIG